MASFCLEADSQVPNVDAFHIATTSITLFKFHAFNCIARQLSKLL